MKKYFFLVSLVLVLFSINFIAADYLCEVDEGNGWISSGEYSTESDCNNICSYADEDGYDWRCTLVSGGSDGAVENICDGDSTGAHICWEDKGETIDTYATDCLSECEDYCGYSIYPNTCLPSGSPAPYIADEPEEPDPEETGESCDVIGEYSVSLYCDFDKILQVKQNSGACDNDYECSTGSCMEGNCQEKFKEVREHTNWLQNILNTIIAFFSGTECVPGEDTPVTCFDETLEGECQVGQETCLGDGTWSECISIVNPVAEICDDNKDNNCDGDIDCDDSSCDSNSACAVCTPGDEQECGTDVGECRIGIQTCQSNGQWGECGGDGDDYRYQGPETEICDDGLDNDCNTFTDCSDRPSCRQDPACDTLPPSDPDGECEIGETQNCGPENETGYCEFGTQTCHPGQLVWNACNDDAVYPREEFCNGIDDNCDGAYSINETEDSTGTEICDDLLDNDCDGLIDAEDVNNCDACQGIQESDDEYCSDFGSDESTCISEVLCNWEGEETIFCGNNVVDSVLNEECDEGNFAGLTCETYNADFTGGNLNCNLQGEVNECMFNTTYCTMTYVEPNPSGNVQLIQVSGLQDGTIVTTSLISSVPEDIVEPANSTFLGGLNIGMDIQPLENAEILFIINKTLITEDNEFAGLYRVEEDNSLTSLEGNYIGETDSYYNYSALTNHFSEFLVFERIPVCGDGEVDATNGEQCDGTNFNGEDCDAFGYNSGSLSCNPAGGLNECLIDIDDCLDETGPSGPGEDDNNDNSGSDPTISIQISVFSPLEDITYGKTLIPLEVSDKRNNAGFWRYSLNDGSKTVFTPNASINANAGTNVLKVYAKESSSENYEAQKIITFTVVDNPNGVCGDSICGVGEDSDSCAIDCGFYSFVDTYCGDGVCDADENSDICSLDCAKREGGSKWIIYAILILILIVGIGVLLYYIYSKSKGKNPNEDPSLRPKYIPSSPRTMVPRSRPAPAKPRQAPPRRRRY